MRDIQRRHQLFGIGYDLGPQRDEPLFATLNPGTFRLHRSPMKLDFPLLHEHDLLALLQGLGEDNNPPFILRECVIERLTTVPSDKLLPGLHAACELEWLTISEPQAGAGSS